MYKWSIIPFQGIGPLRFGMSRIEARAVLDDEVSTFRKAPGITSETDVFNKLGLHLYYDGRDLLEFVEAFEPCDPCYEDTNLLGNGISVTTKSIEAHGTKARYDDGGYFFDDCGFALFASGDVVTAVSIYRRGYYDA